MVEYDCACFLRIAADGGIDGKAGLALDCWQELTLRWNLDDGEMATWQIDKGPEQSFDWVRTPTDGPSYLHLQTLAEKADPHGLLVQEVAKDPGHDRWIRARRSRSIP